MWQGISLLKLVATSYTMLSVSSRTTVPIVRFVLGCMCGNLGEAGSASFIAEILQRPHWGDSDGRTCCVRVDCLQGNCVNTRQDLRVCTLG